MTLADDLKARGLVEHSSAPIEKILGTTRTVYFGADPTADSLHVGHLVPLLIMKRLADAGHKIVLLVGGGTGMIGDPKEKGERPLLDSRTIARNKKALRLQMQRIIGSRVALVDNADWLLKVNLVEFLREIGKHFTINEMVKRDIIRRRLDNPDDSISYTEFAYSLLQGYDYLVLNQKKGVDLQVGGSDQWVNILSGVELIRRKLGKEAFALTGPIVTDSTGKKFGKSEGNAVWLDAAKTSPYAFYQFWFNLPDDNLQKYFHIYTFMSIIEIDALIELHKRSPGKRDAQRLLAHHVTELVHGKLAAEQSAAVSEVLFGDRPLGTLSASERTMLLQAAPSVKVSSGMTVVEALVESQLAASRGAARRLIEAGGVNVAGATVTDVDASIDISQFSNDLSLLRKGKRDLVVLRA